GSFDLRSSFYIKIMKYINHLNMVGFMFGHDLVSAHPIQYTMHYRPLSICKRPTSFCLIFWQLDSSSRTYITPQFILLRIYSAPYDFSRTANTTQCSSSFFEEHRRLAHAARLSISISKMRCGHRTRDQKHPNELLFSIDHKLFAITKIMQRIVAV